MMVVADRLALPFRWPLARPPRQPPLPAHSRPDCSLARAQVPLPMSLCCCRHVCSCRSCDSRCSDALLAARRKMAEGPRSRSRRRPRPQPARRRPYRNPQSVATRVVSLVARELRFCRKTLLAYTSSTHQKGPKRKMSVSSMWYSKKMHIPHSKHSKHRCSTRPQRRLVHYLDS